MGRRNQHSRDQQREMALAAAERLLAERGSAGFAMREVAQAIGYTVGQLYLLFDHQDDLLESVNERTADCIDAELRNACERQSDPRSRLDAMASAYLDFALQNPQRWRLLFEHQRPPASPPRPALDLRIQRLFERAEEPLGALLDLDPPSLSPAATALWSSIHGVGMLAVSGKLPRGYFDDVRPLSALIMDCFLAGLAQRNRIQPR